MRDLTRPEQVELVRLLGLVIDNGTAALRPESAELEAPVRAEVVRLTRAAELVREACSHDLTQQEG